MGLEWQSMLTLGGWLTLAAIPPALVALYFLKLRRTPLLVPSTYLWRQAVEELHVNSLWQRLRRSLLLLLQLLAIGLMMLALGRPGWRGSDITGDRFIILIDRSASMSATDVAPSRLDEAKRRVGELIDALDSDDSAMIVTFADDAQVVQSWTRNRQELRRSLSRIEPSDRPTSLAAALRVAIGSTRLGSGAQRADDDPDENRSGGKLYLVSDGKFPDLADASLGGWEPVWISIGSPTAENVGITALGLDLEPSAVDTQTLFVRLENFGPQSARGTLTLKLDERLIDAQRLELTSATGRGLVFELGAERSGLLVAQWEAETADVLAVDDRAAVHLAPRSPARVLLVTPGNRLLQLALGTSPGGRPITLRVESPAYLTSGEYQRLAAQTAWDLVIFDRCAGTSLPTTHTWSIGALPADGRWRAGARTPVPQLLDVATSHPLMQLVDLSDVVVAEAMPLSTPQGGTTLIESTAGPLLAIAPRERFEDLVLGIDLLGDEGTATNWPVRLSFPLFLWNVIDYFSAVRLEGGNGSWRAGDAPSLRLPQPASGGWLVADPTGNRRALSPGDGGLWNHPAIERVGVYQPWDSTNRGEPFTVNLLDPQESDVRPRVEGSLQLGYRRVEPRPLEESTRREGWRWLVLAALGVLLLEWYLYHRRLTMA